MDRLAEKIATSARVKAYIEANCKGMDLEKLLSGTKKDTPQLKVSPDKLDPPVFNLTWDTPALDCMKGVLQRVLFERKHGKGSYREAIHSIYVEEGIVVDDKDAVIQAQEVARTPELKEEADTVGAGPYIAEYNFNVRPTTLISPEELLLHQNKTALYNALYRKLGNRFGIYYASMADHQRACKYYLSYEGSAADGPLEITLYVKKVVLNEILERWKFEFGEPGLFQNNGYRHPRFNIILKKVRDVQPKQSLYLSEALEYLKSQVSDAALRNLASGRDVAALYIPGDNGLCSQPLFPLERTCTKEGYNAETILDAKGKVYQRFIRNWPYILNGHERKFDLVPDDFKSSTEYAASTYFPWFATPLRPQDWDRCYTRDEVKKRMVKYRFTCADVLRDEERMGVRKSICTYEDYDDPGICYIDEDATYFLDSRGELWEHNNLVPPPQAYREFYVAHMDNDGKVRLHFCLTGPISALSFAKNRAETLVSAKCVGLQTASSYKIEEIYDWSTSYLITNDSAAYTDYEKHGRIAAYTRLLPQKVYAIMTLHRALNQKCITPEELKEIDIYGELTNESKVKYDCVARHVVGSVPEYVPLDYDFRPDVGYCDAAKFYLSLAVTPMFPSEKYEYKPSMKQNKEYWCERNAEELLFTHPAPLQIEFPLPLDEDKRAQYSIRLLMIRHQLFITHRLLTDDARPQPSRSDYIALARNDCLGSPLSRKELLSLRLAASNRNLHDPPGERRLLQDHKRNRSGADGEDGDRPRKK